MSSLLGVSAKDAEAGVLVNGSVLEKAELLVGDAAARNNFDVDQNALTGMIHWFIRFGFVLLLHLLSAVMPSRPITR